MRRDSFLHHTGIEMQNLNLEQSLLVNIRAELSSNAFIICRKTSPWYGNWFPTLAWQAPGKGKIYDTVLMWLWKTINYREISPLITSWKSFCCGVTPSPPLLTGKVRSTQITTSSLLLQWIFLFWGLHLCFLREDKWPFSSCFALASYFHTGSVQTQTF